MTDYRIRRLGHLGDGIAEGPVYVPGALPGEVVTGIPDGDHLKDVRIVTPSSDRVAPPCRHFKSCGGCQMQHLSDSALADWKIDIVRTALQAQGLQTDFLPIHTSPPNSRRRATFAARRTKKGAMAGFYGKRSDAIVEIPDCRLLHPRLMAALPVAEKLAETGASRKTALRVAATLSEPGLDIAVTEGKPLDGPLRMALAELCQAFDLARLSWDGETIATRLPPEQRIDGISVVPPAGAFLQATKQGEETLRTDVLGIVDGASSIIDLFAGCGTFSLPAARKAAVHAVEGDPAMTVALDAGWRRAKGLRKVTTETRDLFRQPLQAEELSGFDAAIIDPPRAGAEAQIAQLAQSGLPVIAHVSCNPVTFARDAALLVRHGYDLTHLRVVDQFRWSVHVELVAKFRKNAS
ncbi:class I SAM-dependent RNA methyltransferase [Roseovarius sp.]|uniref:class I SAM-dependent RNA methyltransferase n=1 Tax=Roseovarius sp. TaxID=1486281 RepID=UPI0026232DDB|nr:class I SAM-dependent RNA methyltransferase [Roseovarius sp.]MDM8166014.1 class I SAM-dependent RNA methyltransferase [Roseovarius sp.]